MSISVSKTESKLKSLIVHFDCQMLRIRYSTSNVRLHQEFSETVVTSCHLFTSLRHQRLSAITISSYWPHQWRQVV